MKRVVHTINGVEFVPTNRDSFSLQVTYSDDIGEWRNDFTVENKVVLPNEAYIELLRHLNTAGIENMPTYNISINGKNNDFFVDLHSGISIEASKAEVSIKNFISKDNIKDNLYNLTFEYLKQSGKITDSDMVKIPYVIIPQDVGSKILSIALMIYVLSKEISDRVSRITERIGDLLAGTVPSVGLGVVYPTGSLIRFGILIAMDVAVLVIVTIMLIKLLKQAFELLLPPLREFKAMTFDRLLTIALSEYSMTYKSTLKSDFQKCTILPVPIDYKKKKFFEMLMSDDDRVLNRGYPTSSDTVPTAGLLVDEICKMYNIEPVIENNILILEPRQGATPPIRTLLDRNFNSQDNKENRFEIDLSKVWNTKIISYQNDGSDKMLFDNPRGLRVEYKTISTSPNQNELTLIKGFVEIRLNFALGAVKEDTIFEKKLLELANVTDKILNTAFASKINKRKGVLALSQEQFNITKLLYQVGGKQTTDYVNKIGAGALGKNYHAIDESKNNVFRIYSDMPTRMDNSQFNSIIQNKFVNLEGQDATLTNVDYLPEMSIARIGYKVQELSWTKNLKTITVYEE